MKKKILAALCAAILLLGLALQPRPPARIGTQT